MRNLHGTCQSVGCGFVDEVTCLLELGIGIDIDGEHRAEDLLNHGHAVRIFRQDNGWLDEVAFRVVS